MNARCFLFFTIPVWKLTKNEDYDFLLELIEMVSKWNHIMVNMN